MSLQKNTFAIATLFSLGLVMTGCAKHEQAEGGNEKFRTEEIAAKQGEAAKAAVKEPDAKEPATFTATTAPASGTASTSSASSTTATAAPNTATATASSTAQKTDVTAPAKTDDSKATTKPKAEEKKPEAEKVAVKSTTAVTTKTEEKK